MWIIERTWPLLGIIAGILAVASLLTSPTSQPNTIYITATTVVIHKNYVLNEGKIVGCYQWTEGNSALEECK
jgi:hypothetical protein